LRFRHAAAQSKTLGEWSFRALHFFRTKKIVEKAPSPKCIFLEFIHCERVITF